MARGRLADASFAVGSSGVLVGVVLPWLRVRGTVLWGWDVSVWWSFTGNADLAGTRPSAAAVVLLLGAALALPVALRVPISAPAAWVGTIAIAAVLAATFVRATLVPGGAGTQPGLAASVGGAAVLAAACLGGAARRRP